MIERGLYFKNIEYMANHEDCGGVSDGDHTFAELYHHRAILTAALCNMGRQACWKSKQHHDGAMYDGYFIVGISTPFGDATYHYSLDYWTLFQVPALDRAPEWDGHTPKQAIDRIKKTFC